jgi:hypothetical protein
MRLWKVFPWNVCIHFRLTYVKCTHIHTYVYTYYVAVHMYYMAVYIHNVAVYIYDMDVNM